MGAVPGAAMKVHPSWVGVQENEATLSVCVEAPQGSIQGLACPFLYVLWALQGAHLLSGSVYDSRLEEEKRSSCMNRPALGCCCHVNMKSVDTRTVLSTMQSSP